MWKSAVADSNVAAQQEGMAALCAFLKFGGREGAVRSRQHTITSIVEKGLPSTRPAIKTNSLEALLLYIELDVPGPVIEEILPTLSNKVPKVVAAALAALTAIFHAYGCKTADPKPVLKFLPKVFGHADKNVRAEATNLTVEFYRWLRDAMKPMFWGELKPTQQTDLEAQFEKAKAEGTPKQERLLRSQQAAQAAAPVGGGDEDEEMADAPEEEEVGEIDAFDLAEPQDIMSKVPKDFFENIASSKWKERKEACEGLYAAVNVPRIKEGDYNEITRCLAKCMKDANIAVVTQAAQCIELLAKGLRRGFGRYRATVMQPILERLKEKKQTVADALGAALDAVFLSTDLTENMEDITEFLKNKNPQVKEGTMKFLVRCLRTTKDVPSKQDIASMVESAKKLLSEGSEALRSGGAEILGTIMKIIGERAMNPHLEGLDDIRKNKIKEFYEAAEVKAKEKPKAPPPAARAPPPGPAKKGPVKKAPLGAKKPAGFGAAAPPAQAAPAPAAAAPPRMGGLGSKLGAKPGAAPGGLGGGLKAPVKRPAFAAPPPPQRAEPEPEPEPMDLDDPPSPEEQRPPPPRMGLGRGGLQQPGGLAGRSLAKPVPMDYTPTPPMQQAPSGLSHIERAELEELRDANDRLLKQLEDARHDRSKLLSEIQELKNQNASLIEDHTRDVLSIKAKETQLVRARSDFEAAEQTNDRLRRELDRLKRALSHTEDQLRHANRARPGSPSSPHIGLGVMSPTHDNGMYNDNGYQQQSANRNRMSFASSMSEEKENGDGMMSGGGFHQKVSPDPRYHQQGGSAGSSGRGTPAGFRQPVEEARSSESLASMGFNSYGNERSSSRTGMRTGSSRLQAPSSGTAGGMESWKRAAEVTSQLKARIEQMKVCVFRLGCALFDTLLMLTLTVTGQARSQPAINGLFVGPKTNDPLLDVHFGMYESVWKAA